MKKTITLLAVCLLLMSVLAGFTAFFNRTEEVGYFTALKVTIRSNATNVYSIISLILGGIEFFIILLTGKEVPKIRSVWLGVLLFTLSFSYQCVSDMLPGLRKEVGAISIMVVTVFFYAYIAFLQQKTTPDAADTPTDKSKNSTSGIALSKFTKRKIHKSHQAITSIQLYKVIKTDSEQRICYDIEYLDSGHRNEPSLNAVLNAQLEITKEEYDLFQPFLESFEKYLSAENEITQDTCEKTMELLASGNIEKLKNELTSRIKAVSDITISDCCSSRLVLTYLSCLARIGKENAGDYVGVRCESLNVCLDSEEANEINKQLFSKFRTGLLGALLLRTRPYVFYYEREDNDAKAYRQYVSFLLDNENARYSYLVLITINRQTNSDVFPSSLLGAITAIREECIKLYLKHEVNRNANT